MKVVHIVHGKANPDSANGISRVVYNLNKYERLAGIDSQIWAVVDDCKKTYTFVRDEYVKIQCYPRVGLFRGHDILKDLENLNPNNTLVHFHMIWFIDKNIIANRLKKLGVQYIITTHGTYSKPHAYTGKRRIARWLLELPYLRGAASCHILTREEGTGLARYGYNGPCFVAYNGFDTPPPGEFNADFLRHYSIEDCLVLCTVSVLRKDKNIDKMIEALSLLPKEILNKVVLLVVGPDYKNNANKYLKLAKLLGVDKSFKWIGPLYKDEKYTAIKSSDGYIMASDSEGFSMSVIDAMICNCPMILTRGCNLNYLSDEKFYIKCEPYAQDLARAIIEFVSMGENRSKLADKANEIARKELSWSKIATVMISNYSRIINSK